MLFTLDPAQVVQLILTIILPIVVGLVTTRETRGAVKAWLLAGLSLVTSVLTELAHALATAATFDLGVALLAAIPTFAIAVATYYGLWKPTGVGVKAQDVEATTLLR
jgi:hypothetical protein